jgi:FtsP/CotA-like multicopper oxidase with cupredoxin domain
MVVGSVAIAPAQRYVVEVRFEEPGTHAIVSRVTGVDHMAGRHLRATDAPGSVTVSDERAEPDLGVRFAELRAENMGIDWLFRVGDVVKVRPGNDADALHPMHHPVHLHGQRFLELAGDGVPNGNLAWKDTALLPVGATADILLEVTNPGARMLHRHIAEHLDAGMKVAFQVEGRKRR